MKKIFFSFAACVLLAGCEMFEIDNYDLPQETITGEVVDAKTGEPVLTDQDSRGIVVKMLQLDWGDNVNVGANNNNPDILARPDGTFQNTKIFRGTYRVSVVGPFLPIVRESKNGVMFYNGSQELEIVGTKHVRFEVEPFLRVRIVGEPQVRAGKITAQVVVERTIEESDFSTKLTEMLGEYHATDNPSGYQSSMYDVTDVQLFVSSSPSVGYAARDERWSNGIVYTTDSFDAQIGKPVTITTNRTIPAGYVMFVRAAARINYASDTNEKRYNYSEKTEVLIPKM